MAGDDDDEIKNPPLQPESIARIVELARKHCTAEHWGEWLRLPLELAACDGDQQLAEELEVAGATGDPLYAAIQSGQLNFVDCRLGTAQAGHLHLAVERGHEAIVSLLLGRGGDPESLDHKGLTSLQLAARAGYAKIVGLLLDSGASARFRLREGKTDGYFDTCVTVETESALDMAAIAGYVDVIKEITQREPSIVHSVSPATKFTALHYAAKHSQLGAIDALVEAGADLEAHQDSFGIGTALHVAVESPDCEATLLALLRHGAHVDSTREGNVTPLCVAIETDNRAAADTLLSAGAEANEPLFFASAEPYSSEMIIVLLRHGANVNAVRASDGNTPLHVAAEVASTSNVEALLTAGGDETATNDEAEIPLDVVGQGDFSGFLSSRWAAIRSLLANARRDRADRAWSRRGFFVLCRVFPGRMRLQLAFSEDAGDHKAPRPASSPRDGFLISRAKKKRVGSAEDGGRGKEHAKNVHAEESATAFRAAMSRLMGLEADVIFRTIVGFL